MIEKADDERAVELTRDFDSGFWIVKVENHEKVQVYRCATEAQAKALTTVITGQQPAGVDVALE